MPLRTEQNTLERAVRQARQAATLEHKTGPASEMAQVKEAERKSKERLAQTMRALTDDEVRYLATTVMLRTPDVHAGATGAGAAWAVASRIANEMGSSELKRRKGVSSAISPDVSAPTPKPIPPMSAREQFSNSELHGRLADMLKREGAGSYETHDIDLSTSEGLSRSRERAQSWHEHDQDFFRYLTGLESHYHYRVEMPDSIRKDQEEELKAREKGRAEILEEYGPGHYRRERLKAEDAHIAELERRLAAHRNPEEIETLATIRRMLPRSKALMERSTGQRDSARESLKSHSQPAPEATPMPDRQDDVQIYTKQEDRGLYEGKPEYWVGIYTDPGLESGLLGHMPLGTSDREIQLHANHWHREKLEVEESDGKIAPDPDAFLRRSPARDAAPEPEPQSGVRIYTKTEDHSMVDGGEPKWMIAMSTDPEHRTGFLGHAPMGTSSEEIQRIGNEVVGQQEEQKRSRGLSQEMGKAEPDLEVVDGLSKEASTGPQVVADYPAESVEAARRRLLDKVVERMDHDEELRNDIEHGSDNTELGRKSAFHRALSEVGREERTPWLGGPTPPNEEQRLEYIVYADASKSREELWPEIQRASQERLPSPPEAQTPQALINAGGQPAESPSQDELKASISGKLDAMEDETIRNGIRSSIDEINEEMSRGVNLVGRGAQDFLKVHGKRAEELGYGAEVEAIRRKLLESYDRHQSTYSDKYPHSPSAVNYMEREREKFKEEYGLAADRPLGPQASNEAELVMPPEHHEDSKENPALIDDVMAADSLLGKSEPETMPVTQQLGLGNDFATNSTLPMALGDPTGSKAEPLVPPEPLQALRERNAMVDKGAAEMPMKSPPTLPEIKSIANALKLKRRQRDPKTMRQPGAEADVWEPETMKQPVSETDVWGPSAAPAEPEGAYLMPAMPNPEKMELLVKKERRRKVPDGADVSAPPACSPTGRAAVPEDVDVNINITVETVSPKKSRKPRKPAVRPSLNPKSGKSARPVGSGRSRQATPTEIKVFSKLASKSKGRR